MRGNNLNEQSDNWTDNEHHGLRMWDLLGQGQIEMLATIPTLNSNNIKPGMLTAAIVKLRLFIFDTLMGC